MRFVVTNAISPAEVVQVADAAKEIGEAAVTVFECTLVGLVLGFVLLRVEGTVESTD